MRNIRRSSGTSTLSSHFTEETDLHKLQDRRISARWEDMFEANIFLSGNRPLPEFRDGNITYRHRLMSGYKASYFVSFARFHALVTAVQDQERGAAMGFRHYYLYYRVIRETVTAAVTIGTAVLLGYLIVNARF